MIVDDHADMRRVLGQIVLLALKTPVEFIECETGEDAIAQYGSVCPDLVLMDIELKSMSGFGVTEEILKLDAKANIIIVTSYDTPTFRRKAKKLKVLGFVPKDKLAEISPLLISLTQ